MTTISEPDRVDITQKNTPLEEIRAQELISDFKSIYPSQRISFKKPLPPRVFIKRDDSNDCILTGNKIRKVEYYLAYASKLKKETHKEPVIITCGPEQSNHLRTTSVAAARLGFERYLMVRTPDGNPPQHAQGNYLLLKLNGARIKFCTPQDYKEKNRFMAEMAKEVEKDPKKIGVVIPEGGSGALGMWGYIKAFKEIIEQQQEVTSVVVSVGSGGSLCGLLLGRAIYNRPDIKIYGVPICDSVDHFEKVIQGLTTEFNEAFGTQFNVKPEFWDGYIGEAGKGFPEELALIKSTFQKTGILFDIKYSGKGFYGLIDHIENRDTFKSSDTVVFIHTGGSHSIFAASSEFSDLI